ncbi:tRNA (guanine-N7-)-methyltransferase [Fragilaria crotonensis]|nr:tRNA (guanine-N7-)-methyltransferase [Fragilaria crotonensis]
MNLVMRLLALVLLVLVLASFLDGVNGFQVQYVNVGVSSVARLIFTQGKILVVPRTATLELHTHTQQVWSSSNVANIANTSTDDDGDPLVRIVSRRRFGQLLFLPVASGAACMLLSPQLALAASPMTSGEADGLKARLERSLRPKAPKVLRSQLNQDFAVLLMRASYNALDQIDCVAMDQFQRDFFFIRQAEYLPYIEQLGPGVVQQGMLTDPYYFDFISFAQYSTISREVNNSPALVFQEQQPSADSGPDEPQTFVSTVVRRDPSITNDMLSARHDQLVGKAIIDRLTETFQGTASAIPTIPDTGFDANATLLALTQLVKLFLVNGFAIDGSVDVTSNDTTGTEFCITLTNPDNLWSGQALKQRNASPTNCFILKAAVELISRAGLSLVASSVKYQGYQEKSYLKIRRL